MNRTRIALAVIGLSVVAACGAPPPPPGTPLEVQASAERGPRISGGSIFAAGDLTTLRSLIDAADSGMTRQLGGTAVTHECLAPYTTGRDVCWPDLTSAPGRAYLAVDVQGGFCTTEGAPRMGVSGSRIELQIPFSDVVGCHLSGSIALPTASLFSFPTDALEPGLYSVSYVFQFSSDTYRSDSTYLSVPGPAAGAPADVEQEAAAALTSVVGPQRAGVFSLARVDGAQLAHLCGQAVAGTAYLVTYEPDVSASPRQMTVALAGPSPRTCATTRV